MLKIDNDVYFDLGSKIGFGVNVNRVMINKIVGWK